MALTRESVTPGTVTALDTLNISVTPAGANRVLFCIVQWGNTQTVSTVVFDAAGTPQSLTRIGGALKDSGEGSDFWYLVNPAAATKNVTVTMTDTPSIRLSASCILYNGADTTTPYSGLQTITGSVNPDPQPSLTVISAVGDLVLDSLETDGDSTITCGQTSGALWTQGDNNSASFGSEETGAASVVVDWGALANFTAYAYAAINVKAAAGGAKKRNLAGLLAQRAISMRP